MTCFFFSTQLQREALLSQLQETRIKLRQELQGANEAGKRAEAAERELRELRCQLEQRATTQSINEPQCKDISLEVRHHFEVVSRCAILHSFCAG